MFTEQECLELFETLGYADALDLIVDPGLVFSTRYEVLFRTLVAGVLKERCRCTMKRKEK